MSTRRALFGSAIIYTVTAAFSAGVPLILLPILTRLFSPEEYGKVAIFAVVVQILGTLTGLSVHGAVGMRYFDRDRLDFPRYVASCLTILLASTALVLVLVLITLPWLEKFTKLPGYWLVLAVLLSGSNFVIQTQLSIWQASKQPLRFGILRITQALTDLVLSLLLVIVAGLAWQGRTGAIAVAGFLTAAVAFVTLLRGKWLRFPIERDYIKNALHFGVPLIPHAIGWMLIAMIDRFLISNILDVASTGIYMVALQIGLVMTLMNDALNRAYSPLLIEALSVGDPKRDVKIVRATYTFFLVLLVLGIALGLLAPAILGVLVGTKFQAVAPVVIFITIGQAINGMYYMVATYVFYAGRTASLAVITLSSGLLNIAISYWLLKTRGLEGAGQAFLIAQAVLFLGTWWLSQRSRPMPWLLALRPRA
ncbi:MAG: oligosaccharide flippase family protein [Burkholderiaceae bacterium]